MFSVSIKPDSQRTTNDGFLNGHRNGNGKTRILTPEQTIQEVKKNFTYVGGGVLGVSALGILLGSLRHGISFPAKAVKVVSEAFGSLAAVASPVFLIGNEVLNFYSRKASNGKKAKIQEVRELFDTAREGYYRLASAGFLGFILEPFINPEKFGKSPFHKIATILNIPNLAFSTVMWAGGNFQALIAWALKTKEQISVTYASQKNIKENHNKRVDAYQQLYNSFKRQAVIGSINNPTMQGLRQFADCLALFSGHMSAREFFSKPFLAFGRIVSFFGGAPEWIAKGVDSFVRVTKERENLKVGLPSWLIKPLENLGKKADKALSTPVGEKNGLKSVRHLAEMTFHTLSPLMMSSLFAPLNDESVTNVDAQSRGGTIGTLDKIVGISGKVFTFFFNTLYIGLGRLPQFFIQSIYFGRKKWGEWKGENEKQTEKALRKIRKNICDNTIINKVSEIARKAVERLVPDFYTAEHEHGYLPYESIQANYALEQAKGNKSYKELEELGEEYKKAKKTNNESLQKEIENKINAKIIEITNNICIPFVKRDAIQGNHDLTSDEENSIRAKVTEKIKQKIGVLSESKRAELPFIGSEFLANYVFKLFDLKTRFNSIDYRSEHHNMTTAYDNDEIRISFEYELLPVIGKCVKGLQNTLNRLQGVSVDDEAYYEQAA